MKAVTLPTIFSGIKSRKDKSYALTFDTRELGKDAAELFSMAHSECWLVIAPSQDAVERIELPDYKPDTALNQKTPAQRLRAVLYLIYKQRGSNGDFEDFYRTSYEQIINIYKNKLDDGE